MIKLIEQLVVQLLKLVKYTDQASDRRQTQGLIGNRLRLNCSTTRRKIIDRHPKLRCLISYNLCLANKKQ